MSSSPDLAPPPAAGADLLGSADAPPAWARRAAAAPGVRKATAAAAVIVAIAFLAGRFLHLGMGDFRHWDEALYAWRAKVAVATGAWGDQSDWTFNGFYSAAFPPLLVWEMAAVMTWAGDVEWAARLPVALHGAAALLGLGALGWILGGAGTGWLALCLLGAVSYFTRYSRAAQFDVPAVSWMILALTAYAASLRWPTRRRACVVASGVALGCGLMTKIAVSAFVWPALVASLGVWWWAGRRIHASGGGVPPAGALALAGAAADRGVAGLVADQLVVGGVAAALWLPWHGWMDLRHGQEFWDWYIGYHLLDRTATVLDHHEGAWWFYLHAAWDRLPPALLALALAGWVGGLVAAAGALRGRGQEAASDLAAGVLPWLWLTTLGALFQSSATKREIYLLILYPAMALLGAVLAGRLFARPAGARLWWAVLVLGAFVEILSRDAGRAYTLGRYLSGAEAPPEGTTLAAELLLVARPHLLGAAALALLPAIAGALGRRGSAPPARAAWWRDVTGRFVLGVLLALSLWRQGLSSMVEPDAYDLEQHWQSVRPWLDDEARFPFVAFVGDGEGPQFMYYLNGNYRDSAPLPSRPIGRFFDLSDPGLAEYARPGGALVMSAWFASHERNGAQWAERLRGWEQVQEGTRYIVFEWRGPQL